MERLTTNKPVEEMGMLELAHNCCYVKDRNARYRDFEMDMDARELTRRLLKDHAQDDDAFESDEDFDEWMVDYLQNGIDTKEGLIALFYRNLWAMAELREQLKAYEDAEEQGLLLRLPCKVGDDVYIIPSKVNYDLNVLNKHEENNRVYHQKVENITFNRNGWYVECDKDVEYGTDRICIKQHFRVTWFLDPEEAEQKLAEMKGE